jgi:transcriptional regulator with XRE-family HTH domain
MIYDDIIAYLSDEYRKGKTYQQIADERGLSFGYIHDLIHGRNKVERMSLETFFKLFPHAQISITGAMPSAAQAEPAADMVPRSELLDLREKYADLRDQYQDLREQYLDLKSRPPFLLDGPGSAAPYHVSGSSKSK